MTSYYNTTHLTGDKLEQSQKRGTSLKSLIHNLLLNRPIHEYTPFEIRDMVQREYNRRVPITSVRRAITDLTTEEVLVKTDIMRNGVYDSPNHTWKLRDFEPKSLFLRSLREAI